MAATHTAIATLLTLGHDPTHTSTFPHAHSFAKYLQGKKARNTPFTPLTTEEAWTKHYPHLAFAAPLVPLVQACPHVHEFLAHAHLDKAPPIERFVDMYRAWAEQRRFATAFVQYVHGSLRNNNTMPPLPSMPASQLQQLVLPLQQLVRLLSAEGEYRYRVMTLFQDDLPSLQDVRKAFVRNLFTPLVPTMYQALFSDTDHYLEPAVHYSRLGEWVTHQVSVTKAMEDGVMDIE